MDVNGRVFLKENKLSSVSIMFVHVHDAYRKASKQQKCGTTVVGNSSWLSVGQAEPTQPRGRQCTNFGCWTPIQELASSRVGSGGRKEGSQRHRRWIMRERIKTLSKGNGTESSWTMCGPAVAIRWPRRCPLPWMALKGIRQICGGGREAYQGC